jgi:hypothetical protein
VEEEYGVLLGEVVEVEEEAVGAVISLSMLAEFEKGRGQAGRRRKVCWLTCD